MQLPEVLGRAHSRAGQSAVLPGNLAGSSLFLTCLAAVGAERMNVSILAADHCVHVHLDTMSGKLVPGLVRQTAVCEAAPVTEDAIGRTCSMHMGQEKL